MENNQIEFHIKVKVKKKWFKKNELSYEVYEHKKVDLWIDPSYGNGGGNFVSAWQIKLIMAFNTSAEAIAFKSDLEQIYK